MNRLILILACLNLSSCYSQKKEKEQDEYISKDYMKVIYEKCVKPDIIEVESTPDGYVEVDYLCDGKRYEIVFKNNIMLFIEHGLSPLEIPLDKIKHKLDKKYPGWILDEVSQVLTNDTTFLKVEVVKDGIEQNLYFTNDGSWLKLKPIDVSSTLDLNAITENTMYKLAKYQFHQPDSIYEMPDLLKEISGIVLDGEEKVYCVQDEIGSIFEYDLKKQEISNSHRFTDIGDFEDLAINKNTIYVLRSDGNLFVYDLKNKTKTYQTMLHVKSLNIEGLFFDEGYLYIACKDALINQSETKRMVYRIKADKLEDIEPYLEINFNDLTSFLTKNYANLGKIKVSFNPSAIAIHPITNEMYIFSASDRFIAIYKDKQLINIIPLSAEVYYKPEGLAFYKNGDLLISSEGDKQGFVKGTINLIKYK